MPALERPLSRIGEMNAHEKDRCIRVAKLLAVEDVAAAFGDGPRDRVDTPSLVRAGQGEDELSLAHGSAVRAA